MTCLCEDGDLLVSSMTEYFDQLKKYQLVKGDTVSWDSLLLSRFDCSWWQSFVLSIAVWCLLVFGLSLGRLMNYLYSGASVVMAMK